MGTINLDREWTLKHNGLVVRRGDLVEYLPEGQIYTLAAMVVGVNEVAYAGYGSKHPIGTQLIAARTIKNRNLPKPEELADANIEARTVTRKLERSGDIPLPPPAEKTLFSPFDQENPWSVETLMTPEEWKAVSRWYDYSLRSLVFDGSWHEIGRYKLRDTAYRVMKALANQRENAENHYVIIHCTLQGKEGREKAVYGYPGSIQAVLAERQRRLHSKSS